MKYLLILFLFYSLPSIACVCDTEFTNILDDYDTYNQIFIARAISVKPIYIHREDGIPPPPPIEYRYKVQLVKSYKGKQNEIMRYVSFVSSCAQGLQVGEDYLFFLKMDNYTERFSASLCSKVLKGSSVQYEREIEFLEILTKRKNGKFEYKVIDLPVQIITGKFKNRKRHGTWTFYLRNEDLQMVEYFRLKYRKGKLIELKTFLTDKSFYNKGIISLKSKYSKLIEER